MSQRFIGATRKYFGTENSYYFVTKYQSATRDILICKEKKIKFLYLLFRDSSLVYHLINIEESFADFGKEIAKIDRHFNLLSNQNQFYRYLQNFNIQEQLESSPWLSEGLDKIN